MRKTFALLDDVLIESLYQPLSDTLADRLGLERLRAACLCLDIAAIGWILSQAHGLSNAVLAWDAVSALPRMLALLLGLAALTSLRVLFRKTGRARRANPLRLTMQPHRGIALLLLLARLEGLEGVGLPELADLVMLLFAASGLYLGACAERPPVRRRVGALAEAGAR